MLFPFLSLKVLSLPSAGILFPLTGWDLDLVATHLQHADSYGDLGKAEQDKG